MARRLSILIVLLLGALGAAPAVASAGCTAAGAGVPTYVDGSLLIYGGMQCTSGNGQSYQVRTYLQANNGGWHQVYGPFVHNYGHPPDGYSHVDPYYVPCTSVPFQATYTRVEIVVQRTDGVTGQSIGYSGQAARPSNCSN